VIARTLKRLLPWRPARAAVLVLACLTLVGASADVIASDLPVLLRYRGTLYLLPTWTAPSLFAGRNAEQIAGELGGDDWAAWPLVRAGPRTETGRPPFSGASRAHPLGTDAFGRDVLAGLVHGTRSSLVLALVVSAGAMLFGALVGGSAAIAGGMWDALMERFVEVVCVFPTVVVMALVQALERRASLRSLLLVVLTVKTAEVARLVRALVLRCLAEDWALAARAHGTSPWRLLRVQIAPHIVGQVAVAGALAGASVVLTETSLAFLELGAPRSLASWGDMLAQIRWGAGAHVLAPAIALLGLTVGALYLLAEGARRRLT
jgi:peptide/nickel transport system permease protein